MTKHNEKGGAFRRAADVIRHRPVDRVPRGEITIEDEVVRGALGCAHVGFEERLRFSSSLGLDIHCLSPKCPLPSGTLPNARDFVWPDLRSWVDASGLFIFAVLDGSFGWGGKIFGFMKFLTLSIHGQETLREFNRSVESLNRDLSLRLADQGVHGLILAEDLAYQSGLFVGPGAMKNLFLPSLARQAEGMLSLGVPVFFHSDGNYMAILPEISAMGFHGLHCIDPDSSMDTQTIRSLVGPEVCLWGTMTARELERWITPAGLEEGRKRIRDAAGAGSFIAGTTSGLFKGLRVERLRALYEKI